MLQHRGLFSPALIAVIVLIAGQARAETITMTIVDNGVTHTIVGSGPGPLINGTPTSTGLSINVAALNALLVADGSIYQFGNLGAGSNFPGSSGSGGGILGISGLVTVAAGATGSAALSITTTESGFTSPSGSPGSLENSGTANFANVAAGGSQTFSSNYNGTVTTGSITQTSTGLALNPHSDNNSSVITTFVTPYSLTNTFSLSLTANPAGSTTAADEFTVLTKVLGAVPEPASLVVFLTGMPLPLAVVFGLMRRRRGVAAG